MADESNDLQLEAPAAEADAPRRTIAVVDGNSLMHRAFHAIPPTMTAPDGRHTNAIFGFVSKLVETFAPDGVICAFDKGKPRVRMEMLPQYKAQRPPMDPILHEQFPMVKDLLRTMDVPVCELEGWEGDDILGTLARRGEAAGYDMLLTFKVGIWAAAPDQGMVGICEKNDGFWISKGTLSKIVASTQSYVSLDIPAYTWVEVSAVIPNPGSLANPSLFISTADSWFSGSTVKAGRWYVDDIKLVY